jgi:hypothetical protein
MENGIRFEEELTLSFSLEFGTIPLRSKLGEGDGRIISACRIRKHFSNIYVIGSVSDINRAEGLIWSKFS